MERIEKFAKIGNFISHGDDSFIDDQGMTNRWAERRRQRRTAVEQAREYYNVALQPVIEREYYNAALQPVIERLNNRNEVDTGIIPQPTAHQRDMVMEEHRNEIEMTQEEINTALDEMLRLRELINEPNP